MVGGPDAQPCLTPDLVPECAINNPGDPQWEGAHIGTSALLQSRYSAGVSPLLDTESVFLSRPYAFFRRHLFGLLLGGGAFWEFVLWAGFFAMRRPIHTGGLLVFEYVFNLTFLALYTIWLVRREAPHFKVVLVLLFAVLTLVINFTYLYWSHGTRQDFNQPLSHLDALYFTLGTLSTAGTGTISATSETSRGLVSLQMAVDMLVLIFAVGMAVSHLAARSVPRASEASAMASAQNNGAEQGSHKSTRHPTTEDSERALQNPNS